jgi:hypothetical protein
MFIYVPCYNNKLLHIASVLDRGDVVEVDTWVAASGKSGMRRDWLVRDCKTGQIISRATRCRPHPLCVHYVQTSICNQYMVQIVKGKF